MSDGPHTLPPEYLGGFWVIEASDLKPRCSGPRRHPRRAPDAWRSAPSRTTPPSRFAAGPDGAQLQPPSGPGPPEPAVMRCHDDHPRILRNGRLKLGQQHQREVVGGFVQQEYPGRVSQDRCERQPPLLPNTELVQGPVLVAGGNEPKGAERHVLGEFGAHQVLVNLAGSSPGSAPVRVRQLNLLGQQAHPQRGVHGKMPGAGLQRSGHELQQGGLPRSVGACEQVLFPRMDG